VGTPQKEDDRPSFDGRPESYGLAKLDGDLRRGESPMRESMQALVQQLHTDLVAGRTLCSCNFIMHTCLTHLDGVGGGEEIGLGVHLLAESGRCLRR
jgi:hypothetical protein